MKENLKSFYQSASFITDKKLDGKIKLVERSPEHQAMHNKLVDAYQRLKAKKTL
jgi:hypothetical protein